MSHRNETSFSGAEVHVGSPPRDFPERTTVYYHDFKGLRWKRNGVIRSPKFSCLGRQWRLAMKIEERDRSAGVEISASLHHAAGDPISVGWSVSVRSSHLPEPSIGENEGTFHPREGSIFYTLPLKQHYSRYLEKGTLVFDVLMNSHEHEPPLPFIPKNPMACNFVQRLFNDENSADIVFTVAHRDPSNNDLIGPLTTTKFYAHSLILKSAAPLLAELCKSTKASLASTTHVDIPGIAPDLFHTLLRSIYGYTIPDLGCDNTQTMEIIDAADKFGVTHLKLEAEAHYVNSLTITLENVMDHFQYADSKNCALLKEAVLDFIVMHKAQIIEKKLLSNTPVDLCNDILAAMMRNENAGKAGGGKDDGLGAMGISELRRKAFEKGLELDGSREMLIAALESNKRVRTISGD